MAAEAEREAAAKSEGDPEPVLSELVDEVTEDDTEGEVELAEVDEVHDLPYPYGYENEPEYAAPGATTETKKNGASEDDFEREDSSFLGFISDLGREVRATCSFLKAGATPSLTAHYYFAPTFSGWGTNATGCKNALQAFTPTSARSACYWWQGEMFFWTS